MRRLLELLRELKRRRVFRVAVFYWVVGWPVLEASSFLISRLELPSWTADLVLILVILGFPIALVLAWAFEVTPEGVVRDAARPEDAERAAGSRNRPARGRAEGSSAGAPSPAPSSAAATSDDDMYDGETVRFATPSAGGGTVQLLPGRLEIVEGSDRGEDIRFESPQGEPPEFTFGRRKSPEPTHIQLKARTVSREHAVMRYRDDGWEIENRSSTNPVRVNGEELSPVGEATVLSEDDRVEMGKIAFRFRED